MAVQTGMATGKLIILIGAGMTGSILMKNGSVTDFVRDISKVFTKYLKEGEKRGAEDTDSLTTQIQRLSNELRNLAGSRSITVVNSGGGQTTNASSYLVPALVVGVAGYGYFWWKGFSWTDVMYVTRKNMANVVSSMSKQLENVTSAVSATKRHLSSRIDTVSKTLDDSVAVQGLIKNEVFEIRGDVARVGGEIGTVQQMIEGLNTQLDQVQNNQDITNQGIILLCHFAKRFEEGRRIESPAVPLPLQNGESSGSMDGILQKLPPIPKSRLERTSSAAASPASGLKELQSISEALSSKPSESSRSSKIYRTLTANMSFSRLQKAT